MKSNDNKKKGKIKQTGPSESILYLPFLATSKECEGNFIDFSHPLRLFKNDEEATFYIKQLTVVGQKNTILKRCYKNPYTQCAKKRDKHTAYNPKTSVAISTE